MASIEKKVRFGGWSKRDYSEARTEIERALNDNERVVRYKRKKCDHSYQYVEYKEFSFFKGGWYVFKCAKCRKEYTTSNDKKAERLRNVPTGTG